MTTIVSFFDNTNPPPAAIDDMEGLSSVWIRCSTADRRRPGKPIENCFVESFNGKLRDECLNTHWFLTLDDARRRIEDWRLDYNHVRPHSSLGDAPPSEFAERRLRPATPSSAVVPPPTQEELMRG